MNEYKLYKPLIKTAHFTHILTNIIHCNFLFGCGLCNDAVSNSTMRRLMIGWWWTMNLKARRKLRRGWSPWICPVGTRTCLQDRKIVSRARCETEAYKYKLEWSLFCKHLLGKTVLRFTNKRLQLTNYWHILKASSIQCVMYNYINWFGMF